MTLAVTVKYRHRENGSLGEASKCCKQKVTGIFKKSSQLSLAFTNTSLFKDPLFSLNSPPSARDLK